MNKHAAIIGAGVMGLLTARELVALGFRVTVFERLTEALHRKSTSFAAGGMLAPYSELESADELVFRLGLQSIPLWEEIHQELGQTFSLQKRGSLFVSHPRDRAHFETVTARILRQAEPGAAQWVKTQTLEPELAETFGEGLFLNSEAHLDNRALLPQLVSHLLDQGVRFHFGEEALTLRPYVVESARGSQLYDVVIDCRGSGAMDQLTDLRGVRGEAFLLHAPEVTLRRPVRLMHPRYSVYIVPRPEQVYFVGATSIESASASAVTVRSGLELLSAAYSVHKGFGEATLVEALHGVRPAFPDNAPRIRLEPGLIAINGLYRHGYLLAPVLARAFRSFLDDKPVEYAESIFEFVQS